MPPDGRAVQKTGGRGILVYSERSWGLNTMLGPRNIHILLIYGIKNGVHVVECCLYTIFRVSGILRHFWCSYANSITPSDSNTPSRTLVIVAKPYAWPQELCFWRPSSAVPWSLSNIVRFLPVRHCQISSTSLQRQRCIRVLAATAEA